MPLRSKTITFISKQNAAAFQSFILPDEYELIMQGKSVTALGLMDRKLACGALVGYFTDDITFQITSLYIAPDYRRGGGATALLDVLKGVLSYNSVIEVNYTKEDDDHLSDFFESCDFLSFSPEDTLYKVTLGQIMDHLKPMIRSAAEGAPCFAEYNERAIALAGNIAVGNKYPCPPDGFLSAGIDRELSTLIFDDVSLGGYLIVDRFAGGELTISGLFANNNPKVFVNLMIGSLLKAREEYQRNTTVMIPVISELGEMMLHKLLPDAELLTIGYAYYM